MAVQRRDALGHRRDGHGHGLHVFEYESHRHRRLTLLAHGHVGSPAVPPPAPPFAPAAVVCDLDGLLVDSEPAWEVAERRLVEAGYGRPWDPAVRLELLGRGPAEASRILAAHLQTTDVAEVDRRLLETAIRQFRGGVPVRPGARDLLTGLRGRMPVGVATNSQRALAELALSSTGLDALVDVVVCVEDVAAPKPAPDVYLRACALLGADPSQSVGFEDSPVGARAARAAGLWVVGCPSVPEPPIEAADVVVGSLEEFDVRWLLEAVSRR